ncbi:hypothetical protein EPO34_01345 [Patescibacteria group bacterium]|nr:MAG: hypothetical protein EPO34_01345 [Patescibacteria group bacterium]
MNNVPPTTQTPPSGAPKHAIRAASEFFGRHVVAFNVLGFVAVLCGVSAYIAQINGSVAAGYALRDLEVRVDALALENEKLEVAARKAQSLVRLEQSVKMMGLVRADAPAYVEAGRPSVALAR